MEMVNSDALIAEALTFYASDLRQQAEFCAYMFDDPGRTAMLDKVAVIEQLLAAHEVMVTTTPQITPEARAEDFDKMMDQAPEVAKIPVGFTSQRIRPQASPKNPKSAVGMPRQPWDVV